ncbi:MAG: alpha amylase N-terminal ig-like domain-containing protein, partial [Lachnospiraceae bacterium]|nr:alpha amylase N-terminal ig-like domain-containing protein [Lachnospiraceae bacterium]
MALQDGNRIENSQMYLFQMRPAFLKRALYSDTTENYVEPAEPNPYGQVTIKFRTAKNNVDRVYLVTGDEENLMTKVSEDRSFDYYAYTAYLSDSEFLYHFRVVSGKAEVIYDSVGVSKENVSYNPFSIIPGYHTP